MWRKTEWSNKYFVEAYKYWIDIISLWKNFVQWLNNQASLSAIEGSFEGRFIVFLCIFVVVSPSSFDRTCEILLCFFGFIFSFGISHNLSIKDNQWKKKTNCVFCFTFMILNSFSVAYNFRLSTWQVLLKFNVLSSDHYSVCLCLSIFISLEVLLKIYSSCFKTSTPTEH